MQPSLLAPLLDRLLDSVGDALNPEAARRLLDIRADRKTQAVVDRLAAKCNEGRLSEAERAEYESYVVASGVLAVLQAKARAALARRPER